MSVPQEIAETALAASTADGCVVIVEEHSETNLRWAANALMPDRADVTMLGSFSTVFVGFGSVGADVNETGSRETQ